MCIPQKKKKKKNTNNTNNTASIKSLMTTKFPPCPYPDTSTTPNTLLTPTSDLYKPLLTTFYNQFTQKTTKDAHFPLTNLLPPIKNLFTHDVVSSAPNVYKKTKVTRTLVGDAGEKKRRKKQERCCVCLYVNYIYNIIQYNSIYKQRRL